MKRPSGPRGSASQKFFVSVIGLASLGLPLASAGGPAPTQESRQYLLIGLGPESDFGGRPGIGLALTVNSFEIGANKAPSPSTGDFLSNGSSGGPTLLGNAPNIPLNALPVFSGVSNDGNIAITNLLGRFNLQGTGVYGDLGIRTAPAAVVADAGTSNSFYNDPQQFPNTFTPTGLTEPGVSNNTGGFGSFVSPSDADPATRIDNAGAGVTGNVNFNALNAELDSARAIIAALPSTGTLVVPEGIISQDTTILLNPGFNVIDIITPGGDFLLSNSNLVIDGPAGASAIFRMPDDGNLLVSNGNLLIGTGGIGLDGVLFFSDRPDNATHFSISNAIINGVAFWSLGASGGSISAVNAQGRTQLIADKITLDQVRFSRSAFIGAACEQACPGDLNGDGKIDITDLATQLAGFGLSSGATPGQGDLDCDGDVDLTDLAGLLAGFGTTCP